MKIDVLNRQQLENVVNDTSIKLEDVNFGVWWKDEDEYYFKLYLKNGETTLITSTNDEFLNYL